MIPFPDKKFSVIYADPPWSYNDKRPGRGGADRHYPTMSIEEIKALPVADLAAPDCLLFIWCTWPMLQEGMETIRAWGFKYKTVGFVWIKANNRFYNSLLTLVKEGMFKLFDPYMGGGSYTRSNSEFVLIGVKGKAARMIEDKSIRQIIYAPKGKHSEKPEEARERISKLIEKENKKPWEYKPKMELFARKIVPGWACWGNEV
jgi:site-specific DNA-methyltransferase (adenine-specific)